MFEKMECQIIRAKMACGRFVANLMKEERGESNFVAVLLIIVIAVAVAGIFKTQISDLVKAVFGKVTSFVNS